MLTAREEWWTNDNGRTKAQVPIEINLYGREVVTVDAVVLASILRQAGYVQTEEPGHADHQ